MIHSFEKITNNPILINQDEDKYIKEIKSIPYELIFERKDSYVETYKHLKTRKPKIKYLGKECDICLELFQEMERVVVLQCNHGFHEKCFQSSIDQLCPFDRIPKESLKVSFLGHSVLFPSKLSDLGKYLHANQDKLNREIQKFISILSKDDKLSFILEKETLEPLLKVLSNLIQNVLNVCQKESHIQEMYALNVMKNELETLWKSVQDNLSDKTFRFQKSFINYVCDFDLQKIRQSLSMVTHIENVHGVNVAAFSLNNWLKRIRSELQSKGINLNDRMFKSTSLYLSKILFNVSEFAAMEDLAKALDRRFLARKFHDIQMLPTNKHKKKFLIRMEEADVLRLASIMFGSDGMKINKKIPLVKAGATTKLIVNEINNRKISHLENSTHILGLGISVKIISRSLTISNLFTGVQVGIVTYGIYTGQMEASAYMKPFLRLITNEFCRSLMYKFIDQPTKLRIFISIMFLLETMKATFTGLSSYRKIMA